MTIGDANCVNVLLDYLFQLPRVTGPLTEEQVRVAAEHLAGKAHKALMAGATPAQIRAAGLLGPEHVGIPQT